MSIFTLDLKTSRRRLLGGGAVAIGASVLGVVAGPAAAQAPKSSQKAVNYQPHPKGGHGCNSCRDFQPPTSCRTVEGPVQASGWCEKYTHI